MTIWLKLPQPRLMAQHLVVIKYTYKSTVTLIQ